MTGTSGTRVPAQDGVGSLRVTLRGGAATVRPTLLRAWRATVEARAVDATIRRCPPILPRSGAAP